MTLTDMRSEAVAECAPRPGVGELLGWMLTNRERFRLELADDDAAELVLPRLLGITTASLFAYGLVMWIVVAATGTELPFMTGDAGGRPGLLSFSLAYVIGIVGAVGICLPSFYFFALQCGFRPTLRGIVVAVAGGQALTAVFLIGLLPVFAACILGAERLGGSAATLADWTRLGLLLPLAAGLVGAAELHAWFTGLAEELPPKARARREGIVSFLGIWSTALYVLVAPVLVYQLLRTFGPLGF
jgi:hypothetical protein